MTEEEKNRELAQAVENLCGDDFDYLHQTGVLENPPDRPHYSQVEQSEPARGKRSQKTDSEESDSQEAGSQESASDEEIGGEKTIFDSSEEEEAAEEENEGAEEGEEKNKKQRGRRSGGHRWPEVGAILEADYEGAHYEAEVISAARYKSGKAVRILTGPATDSVERSMSGAMLKATEKQRKASDLGKKGVSNGWKFWKVKKKPSSTDR